ncbi:drug resistance transporter EmrB/QacA subfamily protein [Marinobacter santoriniensis NKSG1]|uniref:Drug resistance transporter EmrB/QacA subfamily protein n=1 Tax=Marinobacter santoriniensis NKSG1 TaxID=1288826 RepID=M7CYP1_9GAMM|nr:DHA2 family efflux MFS transporter permease subunit [Marinobacter santoriniensis]EMP57365.1 drug resistance transporter EmrB/QacA subfamily protein [Marinobacter santoriniensis NKSG1]
MTQVDILFERYGPKYQWLASLTVLLGLVALGMSITIVNVATPYIKGAFGMSADQVQWLSTGFLAATTVALLVAPWLVSAFGQRATYITVLMIFIAASFMGGLATGMGAIIAARIIQGAMTGLIRPVALEALFAVFPANQRGMATAMYGMSLGLPLTLATVIGGWLVETYNWRYVFFIVPPICMAAIVMAYFFLPPRESSGPRPPFDWFGAGSLFIAIFALLTALSNGQRWGWHSNGVISLIVASMLIAGLFIWWERRVDKPLLDLAIFRNKGFLMGAASLFLFGGAFYGIMYLLPNFVQAILHYDPVKAGILFTPSTLVLAILVPIVGKLSDRVPPHYLTLPGLAFAIFAVYQMSQVDRFTSFSSLAVSMALLSVGMAAFPPPTLSRAISSLPPRLIGFGSGAINFAMQMGGAFGTATLVTLMDQRTLFHSAHLTDGLNAGNPMAMQALSQLQSAYAAAGTNAVYQQAASLRALGNMDALWASIFAYQDGFWAVVAGLILVVVPSCLLSRWSGWSGETDSPKWEAD